MCCGNSFPLIAVNTDAEQACLRSYFLECAITGFTAGTKDHIRAIIDGLLGGGGTPFGIGEGHIQTTGVVGGNQVDIRIDILVRRPHNLL